MPTEARDLLPGRRELSEGPRRALTAALTDLKNNDQTLGAVERIVSDYCRDRYREGADPAAVIIEVKSVARSILPERYVHFNKIISSCIRHYFGDVQQDLPR